MQKSRGASYKGQTDGVPHWSCNKQREHIHQEVADLLAPGRMMVGSKLAPYQMNEVGISI